MIHKMNVAPPKAKVAVSAWLKITFWLGIGLTAPLTGWLLAEANYALPFLLSSVASITTGILTWALIHPYDAERKKI